MKSIIDAHVHLDHYDNKDLEAIIYGDAELAALIGVSFDLVSCKKNLELSNTYPKILPSFGWHPEQDLISDADFTELIDWMTKNQNNMVAVGEVGLPYYLRKENSHSDLPMQGYLEILESFIKLAKKWEKPIVLHAIYDDAPLVCDLLEKHTLANAHFHWFKGDNKTISRMIDNGYFVSVTPDILYENEIYDLVSSYPLDQIMVETDGPWPFSGPFEGILTNPSMIHQSIKAIAEIKKLPIHQVYMQLFENTKRLYQLKNII